MLRSALALLPLVIACGDDVPDPSEPEDSADTGSDTTGTSDPTTETEPPLWLVSGQEGLIVAVDKARGAGSNASYAIAAMFGDQLQGVATSAWCQAGGPCLASIPASGSEVDATGQPLDPRGTAWTWNGHTLSVGTAVLPFSYNPGSGLAWYSAVLPSSQDPSPLGVAFDGLWGAFEGEIVLPEPLVLTAPDPTAALDIAKPIGFRWEPTGEDDVFLRLEAAGLERVWHLEDDGTFDLDPSALGIALGAEARLSIGRWHIREVDVNGNALTLMGVWEQPYAPLICEDSDFPVGNITQSGNPQQPIIAPASVAVGFQALIDGDTIRDFEVDADGNGSVDLLSAAMIFEFFDAGGTSLCSILYDASPAVYAGQPAVAGSGTIFDAWELNLANGFSTCSAVDPAIWGTPDLRAVVQSLQWGFGVGTIADTETALSGVYDWPQWEPLLAGAYIKYGGQWVEVGAVPSIGMTTCGVIDDTLTALPKPTTSPLPTRLYLGNPVVQFDL